MQTKILFFVIALFATTFLYPQELKLELKDLIHQAIKASPKLKMLRAEYDAAESRIEINSNLPDPMLTLGLINLPTNSFSFTQEPMTGKVIGLSQGIPFPGSLSAKANVKSADTSIVRREIEDLKNKIRNEVIQKYLELQLTREQLSYAIESENLLNQISDVARSKYESSKASLQNIIQVEVQITRVKDKIELLRGKENGLVAELNALALRDLNSEIITDYISPISDLKFDNLSLIEDSKLNRPFLKKIENEMEKSKYMEEAAEYEFYPNFNIGAQYSQRDEISKTGVNLNDFFSVIVGVTLPINYGGKKRSKVDEAKFMQSFYLEKYNSSIQDITQSVGKITAKIKELSSREKLVENTLLPQSEKLLEAALADYQVARIDFVNVIKAESDILDIKTELAALRADYYKNLAQLEFLTGKSLQNN